MAASSCDNAATRNRDTRVGRPHPAHAPGGGRRTAGRAHHRVRPRRGPHSPRERNRAPPGALAGQRPHPSRPGHERTSRPRRAAWRAVLDRRPREHERHARQRRADPGEGAQPRRPHHPRTERGSLLSPRRITISPMRLKVAAATDPGLEREENEDSVVVWRNKAGLDTLLVVCDGMGGHAAGQMASSIAVTTLTSAPPDDADPGPALDPP